MYNPYVILGISPSDSEAVRKKKYKILCKKYHPDSPTGDGEKFLEITRAWQDICSAPSISPILKKARWHHKSIFEIVKEVQ